MSLSPTIEQLGSGLSYIAVAVLGGFIPKLMDLRKRGSSDAAQRAMDAALISKSGAESDYFETAVSSALADRDNWRKSADEAWRQLRIAESQVARLTALQESHERELRARDRQIEHAWGLLLHYAPRDVKAALEVEYYQTRPASLDDLPPAKGKK